MLTGRTRCPSRERPRWPRSPTGTVRSYRITPEDAGLERAGLDDIAGGDAAANAAHIRDIFAGDGGARRNAVLINAGFVAVLADRAQDVKAGVALARETIASGAARRKLDELREASCALKETP